MQDNEAFQEQAVEITLGPKGAFEEGNVGVIKRRVPTDGVVNAVTPQQLSKPRHQKIPRKPRVAELLRKAMEWQELLKRGTISSQADIARREGLSRARVTQIMDLLNLAQDIQRYILSMPEGIRRSVVTERSLRPILKYSEARQQIKAFSTIIRLGKDQHVHSI